MMIKSISHTSAADYRMLRLDNNKAVSVRGVSLLTGFVFF